MPLTQDGKKLIFDGGLIGATVYISLHSAAPTNAGKNELAGNAYARVAVASANWTVSGADGLTNAQDVNFPAPTGNWAEITHVGIYDGAGAAAKLLYFRQLVSAVSAPGAGDTVRILAGDFDVQQSDAGF